MKKDRQRNIDSKIYKQIHTCIETRQRDRQTERHRQKVTWLETDKERGIYIQRERHRHIRMKYKDSQRQIYIHIYKQIYRQKQIQTEEDQ